MSGLDGRGAAPDRTGGYPPARHVLRDLPFELEVVGSGRHRAHLLGEVELGGVLTVLDVLGGALCATVVAPDWMATSSLTLRWADELGPAVPDPNRAPVVMDASVLRAGSRSVTIEVELRRGPTLVGDAVLVFSRLPRRESNLALPADDTPPGHRVRFELLDRDEPGRWHDEVATTVLDPTDGVTETALTPYVRNSFGALNGGVAAALAARAAQLCATTGAVVALQVDDLAVHHLGQGRVGPVRTRARRVLARAGREVVRVELHDVGSTEHGGDGRLMVVAHVGLSPVPAGD